MSQKILVVEDDLSLREAICETLRLTDYEVIEAASGEGAVSQISKINPDLIISDVNMPGMDGYSFLNYVVNHFPRIPFILITAYATVKDAVNALRNGAKDYIQKPFEPNKLIQKIEKYLHRQTKNQTLPVVENESTRSLFRLADRVSRTDATVLITGESGTGKEVLARYIHRQSGRAEKPFVAINCAAIPKDMLEATLFGYEKGAFTGAIHSTSGKFEQANGGTLLLDEVSEMDVGLQAKLLRVLQEKEVERLGSRKTIDLDVRVIATSNRNLKQSVEKNEFREDLYYRLNVFPLEWKPLRDRKDEIIPLANYFINRHWEPSDIDPPILSKSAESYLINHGWQGNVRELENAIQRSLILCDDNKLRKEHFSIVTLQSSTDQIQARDITEISDIKKQEYELIIQKLSEHSGNRKVVAEKLGISQRTLRYKIAKIKEYGYCID